MDQPQPEQPNEADRLAQVFQNIDSWVGDPNFDFITAFVDNHARSGTFVGGDISREFFRILFNGGSDEKLPHQTDCGISLLACRFKASDLYHQFRFMVNYLEADRGREPIQSFIQAIKQDVNAGPHWQISPTEEFKRAWDTFWNVLDFHGYKFHPETGHQADTFRGQIENLFFPSQSQKIQALASFSINLTDLESVDFRVKPTKKLHEHLLIEGDTVNIFKLVVEDIDTLLKYEQNRAAIALEIATLGREILASLKALYGKNEFFSKAEEAEIFEAKNVVLRTVGIRYVSRCIDSKPRVLAHRAYILQRHVEHRRSWLPSLVRDMKKQFKAQPLFFYGAMLAVFFGVCTVIQAVASVLSLFK